MCIRFVLGSHPEGLGPQTLGSFRFGMAFVAQGWPRILRVSILRVSILTATHRAGPQVLALQSALHDLGPWPAMALAASAFFSSSGSSQQKQLVGKSAEQAVEEDLRRRLEPTDLGPPPSASVGRELM